MSSVGVHPEARMLRQIGVIGLRWEATTQKCKYLQKKIIAKVKVIGNSVFL